VLFNSKEREPNFYSRCFGAMDSMDSNPFRSHFVLTYPEAGLSLLRSVFCFHISFFQHIFFSWSHNRQWKYLLVGCHKFLHTWTRWR